jgi:hypothetical protein
MDAPMIRSTEMSADNGANSPAYLTHETCMGWFMTDQVPMFENLVMDNPEAAKADRGPTIFQENLLYLMNRDKVELMDIHRGTGISVTTIYDWYTGNIEAPMAGENLRKLARYFNVSLQYLLYDEGDDSPYYTGFKEGVKND